MNRYLIKGINKEERVFEIVVYAENITHAAMTTIDDFIKEIIKIEKI